MASSRLERIGTIYTRVRGLLRSGAMKPADKPLWYDVYEAFPPKTEPLYDRKPPENIVIRNIFYPEDVIRARFYKKFGSPGTVSLLNKKHQTPCQKFLDKYREMEKDFTDENELFEAVTRALEMEKIAATEAAAAGKQELSSSEAQLVGSKPSTSGQPLPRPNVKEYFND